MSHHPSATTHHAPRSNDPRGRSLSLGHWAGVIASLLTGVVVAGDALTPADRVAAATWEQDRVATVARVSPAVVCVMPRNRTGGGSGVVISPDGYGLTNYHVVRALRGGRGLGGLDDGKAYPLEVLGVDPSGDVAMFKLSGKDAFTPAPLGDSSEVRPGDFSMAMGNPFVLAEDYSPTVTFGMVSGVGRYQWGQGKTLIYSDCIQISTSINPGNSGGPLFNMAGEVIGINGRGSFEERGRVNSGVGYAISINQIKRFIPSLQAGLITEHATMGATVFERDPGVVVIDQVLEDGAAWNAGIRLADRIVALDGRPIPTANAFGNIMQVYPANWPVSVTFERDGQRRTVWLRLERLPLKTRTPWKVDLDANYREVRRVHDAAAKALGSRRALRAVGTIAWTARRTINPGQAGQTVVDMLGACTPAKRIATGAGEHRWAWGELLALLAQQPPASQPAPRPTSGPTTAPIRAEWFHAGGDGHTGAIVELLQYRTPDGRITRYAFDWQTHLPVRIDRVIDGTLHSIALDDYRQVGPVRLPHRLRGMVGAVLLFDERISAYELGTGGQP